MHDVIRDVEGKKKKKERKKKRKKDTWGKGKMKMRVAYVGFEPTTLCMYM